MKFALIGETVEEAKPGLSGSCRDCGNALIAKCGKYRIWHWAHKSSNCDPWWEPETEWHRGWKNRFPIDWQEVGHVATNGERHRADVKTVTGRVIEFQHSALREDERISRELFYSELTWVVDASRRKRDRKQFFSSLSGPLRVASGISTYTIHRSDSVLLRDWGTSPAPVYFDFGAIEPDGITPFWRLYPHRNEALAYVSPVDREDFVKAHLDGLNLEEQLDQIFARDRQLATARSVAGMPIPRFSQYPMRRSRRF